ncbi:efflux RND transporter permease subunit [Trinickia soli]|uniref:efflux RND transporter permease subunit n=1 Tax=Trinickia soli TaxID=380675 RepID=UPI003FA36DC7
MAVWSGYLRAITRRPVAWTLLALGPVLGALLATQRIPLSALPEINLPTILVSAAVPGASAQSMAATVATPLERTLGKTAGLSEMTSTSGPGATRIALQFEPSRSQYGAARDVQAGIMAARTLLPSNLVSNPSYKAINSAEAPVMLLTLSSDVLSTADLYDLASSRLVNAISQLDDIGAVDISGASLPALHVQVNPVALAAYGLSFEQVREQVAAASSLLPIGGVESDGMQRLLASNSSIDRVHDYRDLILKYRGGAAVRVSDVGSVVRAGEDAHAFGLMDGKPAVVLTVRRRVGGNMVDASAEVRRLLPTLRRALPGAVTLAVGMDFTTSIQRSVWDSALALLASAVLVGAVVVAFLRDWRAGVVACVAVPAALSLSFVAIDLLGFSVNMLTLMALSISCGFIIDDAIVLLDGVAVELDDGWPVRTAVARALRRAVPALVAMALSMASLLSPILLWGGIVGEVIREFAWTLVINIFASLLVCSSVLGALAARYLARRPGRARGGQPGPAAAVAGAVTRAADRASRSRAAQGIDAFYRRSLEWLCDHRLLAGLLMVACVGANVLLFAVFPKTFLPRQDKGLLVGSALFEPNTSEARARAILTSVSRRIGADPAVEHVVAYTGAAATGDATLFVKLADDGPGRPSADAVAARIGDAARATAFGARLSLTAVQDFSVGTRQANGQYQLVVQADDLDRLAQGMQTLSDAMRRVPGVRDVASDIDAPAQQAQVRVDRPTAGRLGVTPASVDATLYDAFGARQIATLYRPANQYHVVLEAAPKYRLDPDALSGLYVPGAEGQQVPLTSLAQVTRSRAWQAVYHDDGRVSATISFSLTRAVALSDAVRRIDALTRSLVLPATVQVRFAGAANAFKQSQTDQVIVLLAALCAVYLVLGILYEDVTHPLTVLSVLPGTGIGAFVALYAAHLAFSMVTMIAFLLVAGIATKNSIMIVDHAIQRMRQAGMTAREAIVDASLRRLRPVSMTSVAAIGAAIPLALSSGAGSEFLRPLGVSVIGGLAGSYLLTLYLTPVTFTAMAAVQRFLRFKRAAS